jgi:hypothetical protein
MYAYVMKTDDSRSRQLSRPIGHDRHDKSV